jgi:hypothetical protein
MCTNNYIKIKETAITGITSGLINKNETVTLGRKTFWVFNT